MDTNHLICSVANASRLIPKGSVTALSSAESSKKYQVEPVLEDLEDREREKEKGKSVYAQKTKKDKRHSITRIVPDPMSQDLNDTINTLEEKIDIILRILQKSASGESTPIVAFNSNTESG